MITKKREKEIRKMVKDADKKSKEKDKEFPAQATTKGWFSYMDQEIREQSIVNTLECIRKCLENLREGQTFFYYVKGQRAPTIADLLSGKIL